MRIIAGTYGGRRIKVLEGRHTRPTTDRVREAIASSVTSARDAGFEGAVVLDAFAGSGAFGIEALSRGAAYVLFIERNAAAARVIRENLETLGVSTQRHALLVCDAIRFAESAGSTPQGASAGPDSGAYGAFDIVFLDPPYSLGWKAVSRLLAGLGRGGSVGDGAMVVYEHAADSCLDADSIVADPAAWGISPLILKAAATRTYGETAVTHMFL